MKVVISLIVALTLAMYSVALAANDSTKTSDNAKTSGTTNTSGAADNTNAPNNTNTSDNNTTTNNKNTSATTKTSADKTWNKANTSTTNKKWNNKKWNKTNTPNNTNTSTNSNTSNTTNKWNNSDTWNSDNASTQELLKVSSDGFAALRAIRAARVAIFNGQPMVATKMLVKAKVDLNAASKNAPTFVAATEATVNGKVVADAVEVGKMNWIPIDGQVSLADTFVVTSEKAQHIKKANEYFKNGKSKDAVEELRLAAINVTCTRVLMPLNATTDWVAKATKLMNEQKYYEANLVLKTAEDGLVVSTTSLVEMPQVKTEKPTQQTN